MTMRLKFELFLSLKLRRQKTVGRLLLICFILLVEFGLKATALLSETISPSRRISSTPLSTIIDSVVPTPSPLLPNICLSGPDTEEYQYVGIRTDTTYLDLSKSINCSGAIISWRYCHHVIGFRNTPVGVWPCVWRRSNANESSEAGYENVGCNRFTVVLGEGDNFRCQSFVPSNPADVIEVEGGDYIGFYLPDSGLLPALTQVSDTTPGLDQYLMRNEMGFTSYLKDSELTSVGTGSALLRAEIDTDWIYPSNVPSSTPSPESTPPAQIPVTDQQPSQAAVTPILPWAVSLIVAVGVTVVLIITVVSLVAYVNCKPKRLPTCISKNQSGRSGDADMEYNDVYRLQRQHYVVAVNKTSTVLRDNPAYDSRYLPHVRTTPFVENATSTLERRQLEHTYESLSGY